MHQRTVLSTLSLVAFCLLLAAPCAAGAAAPDQEYSYARIVRLSYVDGDVQVQRPEITGWEDALLNLPIRQGYQISTRQGRAEIEFESGAVARLAEDTQLQFVELALADGNRFTQLSLVRGTATFYANLGSDDRFSVATPHFTVNIPRNARFRIDAGDDGATVSVLKGDVTVEALGASYRVTKNRAFLFRVAGEQVTLARAPQSDAWDRWVDDRENILSASHQSASLRYTRAPFSYGMSDLDYYGGWYNLPGYGYGWQPRGISIGWSPYCSGQWMHVGGFLTWVSFEPWGWAPYHYGHWIFARNGWFWVPGGFHHWQPAIVYWVNLGGNRWGWGPRAPHDRPGQPPANLPHGTVVPTVPPPHGYVGIAAIIHRNERPPASELTRGQVAFETPTSFDEGVKPRARATKGLGGDSQPTAPVATTAPTAPAAAASGYSGAPGITQPPAITPEERRDPRTRGRTGDAAPGSGIVFDPKERRYVNAPETPGRGGANSRSESAGTPTAPAPSGYSGTPPATTGSSKRPAPEVRRVDQPAPVSGEARLPGRRDQQPADSTTRVRPWQQPRQDAQPQQRTPSTAAPQTQPRAEQPRSAPAQQPRWESQPRPAPAPQSQPQPRVEPARPSTPPPAPAPAPRSETRTRPPKTN